MGGYHVILADPPWSFSAWNPATAQRHVGKQYGTMTSEAIATLPVQNAASADAALFLWATYPNLPAAFNVMGSWGFAYKTVAFTWVKTTRAGTPATGMGYYTRSNAEVCLLGIRGRMERKARDVAQVILSPRREHSRKPDEQYDRIMRLFDGPYLEMFARQRWPGWDVWGNETDRFEAEASSYAEAVAG